MNTKLNRVIDVRVIRALASHCVISRKNFEIIYHFICKICPFLKINDRVYGNHTNDVIKSLKCSSLLTWSCGVIRVLGLETGQLQIVCYLLACTLSKIWVISRVFFYSVLQWNLVNNFCRVKFLIMILLIIRLTKKKHNINITHTKKKILRRKW